MSLGAIAVVATSTALLLLSRTEGRVDACSTPRLECPAVAELFAMREGYGRAATGGSDGKFVVVTSDADSGPGTLRHHLASADRPLWIIFASDMTIDLQSQLNVMSDITIDGRGHSVTLHDWGLTLVNTKNVIVTHIAIDGRFRQESQAVNVVSSHDIWLNHLTLSRSLDRLVNVKTGSTDVTLSWIRFENHNRVMLFNNLVGADLFEFYDRDSQLRVTLHHSYFVDTIQRHPRAQMGTSHIYNNLLENWNFYGMSFSLEHRALIEGNIFSNTANRSCQVPKQIGEIYCSDIRTAGERTALVNGAADHEYYEKTNSKYHYAHDWRAFLRIGENLYLGNAKSTLTDYRPEQVPVPPYCYSYERPGEMLAERIRVGAGNIGSPSQIVEKTCPDSGAAKP